MVNKVTMEVLEATYRIAGRCLGGTVVVSKFPVDLWVAQKWQITCSGSVRAGNTKLTPRIPMWCSEIIPYHWSLSRKSVALSTRPSDRCRLPGAGFIKAQTRGCRGVNVPVMWYTWQTLPATSLTKSWGIPRNSERNFRLNWHISPIFPVWENAASVVPSFPLLS